MGYLGGVNFNILVAFVCQLFPAATPSIYWRSFFPHLRGLELAVAGDLVCRPVDHGYGFESGASTRTNYAGAWRTRTCGNRRRPRFASMAYDASAASRG